jgi:hypothetical protein
LSGPFVELGLLYFVELGLLYKEPDMSTLYTESYLPK